MFKLIFIQCINIIFSCKRFLQPKIDKGYFRQFYVIRSIASKMDEKGENLHKICQNFTDLWPEKWDEEQWNWSKKNVNLEWQPCMCIRHSKCVYLHICYFNIFSTKIIPLLSVFYITSVEHQPSYSFCIC